MTYPKERIQNLVDGYEAAIQKKQLSRASEILRFMKSRGLTIGTNNRIHDELGHFTGHKLND